MDKRTTYEKIISAAYELFSEKGYEATSINAIVERAGVSKGALYHYFKSKEELLLSVFEAIFSKSLWNEVCTLLPEANLKSVLLNMGYSMIDYAQSDKYYKKFLIETMAFSAKNETLKEKFLNYLKEYQKELEELIKEGINKREISSSKDPSIISQEIVMFLDAIALYLTMESIDFDYKKIWKEFIEGIFNS